MQPGKTVGEGGERSGGRAVVVELSELGHPVGLADHQATQLHDRLLQHSAQIVGGQGGQVCLEVGGVGQRGNSPEKRRDGALQCLVHDREQELVLVAEVLVHGLFGHLGRSGDVVDTGALIAVAQEELTACRQDRLALERRTSDYGWGHAASYAVLDSLVLSTVPSSSTLTRRLA